MKFLKVTIPLNKTALTAYVNSLSEDLQERIFKMSNDNCDVMLYKITNSVNFIMLKPTLEKEFFSLSQLIFPDAIIEDVSKEALYNFYNTTDADVILAKQVDLRFNEFLKEYVSLNSDTDTVLDKISFFGMESLTETDKKILKYA